MEQRNIIKLIKLVRHLDEFEKKVEAAFKCGVIDSFSESQCILIEVIASEMKIKHLSSDDIDMIYDKKISPEEVCQHLIVN